MIFKPFDKQAEFLLSEKRIRILTASKRCIKPDTKVLTLDGEKAFCDIVHGDHLLSFDQRANRYSFERSTSSFHKATGHGFRIIHSKGEFVASESHLVLTKEYGYLPLDQIVQLQDQGASAQALSFVSPHQTILEFSQLMWLLSERHLKERHEDCLDDCLKYSHQYDRLLLYLKANDLVLFQPLFCVLKFFHHVFRAVSLHWDAQGHMELIRSHLYQWTDHSENQNENHIFLRHCALFSLNLISFDTFARYILKSHRALQFLFESNFRQSIFLLIQQLLDQVSFVPPNFETIIRVEKINNQEWWDVSVENHHNYYAHGVIHHNSGKSEACYIDCIMKAENRPNWVSNDRDPYMMAMILPTDQMLKKLAWPKFFQFAKPLGVNPNKDFNKTENRLMWPNGSVVYGISAEKIQRMEGLKLNHILMDEAFQMHEDVFYESLARLSDSKGSLVISGSLGTNIINPKKHWIYKNFIEQEFVDTDIIQWRTIDNPYFPHDELERLKEQLDPRTYRALFEIDWNIAGNNVVFEDFSEANITEATYNPELETAVAIDWGWSHPLACLFVQYDKKNDTVTVIDEIVRSKMTLEKLYQNIMAKPYRIRHWYCDAAGDQTREQSGISNITWFAQPPRNINFQRRRTSINHAITLIRTWILNGKGQRKLFISSKCKHLLDEMRNYSYKEKQGEIIGELPVQEGEDAISALRYYFINRHDTLRQPDVMKTASRFGEWRFN